LIDIRITPEPNGRVKPSEDMMRVLTITPATQLIVNSFINRTHDPLTPLKLSLALSFWRVRPIISKLLTVWSHVRYRVSMCNRESSEIAGTNTPTTRWRERQWWSTESRKPLYNNYARNIATSIIRSTLAVTGTTRAFAWELWLIVCS